MADIETRLGINVDTSDALANIKALQRQIAALHQEIARGGAAASAKAFNLQQNLVNTINSTGKFAASMDKIATSTESFTTALEKNKLSMGQYFKYAGGASKSFGKFFKTEMDTIGRVAIERVKDLQTQYIKMGRDANGAMRAIKVRPLTLDMNDLGTKTAIAAQKQQLLNQLLKQGSTAMLNWGKNTQWAGRQLMVGFTIPLGVLGSTAAKVFADMEKQAIAFKRVYGDSFTAQSETNAMLKQVQDLATEFTKYGVAVSDTMGLAAKAAATGKVGADLIAQTTQATRLSVLGQVEQQQALETTISLQNAFGTSSEKLGEKINFLNAVENQTITSIEDLTIAIPKAGPVVKQLGGNVEDLTFFLTAMKEGGINASEGANALKSGLASIINPTGKASEMLKGFGINLENIVSKNKGDVKGIVIDFAKALDTLDPLNRAQAIEQLFGKFQFSRLSTLFQNVIKEGSQASRVLDLTSRSTLEMATIANRELRQISSSPLYQFQKAIESFKKELAPVGEEFMKAITPLINFGTDVLKAFNNLDNGVKQFIVNFTGIFAGLGPILLMTFGLIANGFANLIKGFAFIKGAFNKTTTASTVLGETTDYMTSEQVKAAAVAASLEQVHNKLTQQFTAETQSVKLLTQAYERMVVAQGGTPITRAAAPVKKFADGGLIKGPGTGTSDSIPAMVSDGEFIMSAKRTKQYGPLLNLMAKGKVPGFKSTKTGGSLVTDFTPSQISEAKKEAGLFKAPAQVRKQTGAMSWGTLEAEREAVSKAVGDSVSDFQLGNLIQKQASHIKEDVSDVSVGGIFAQIKNWLADNLVPDLGYVNNYLNSLKNSTKILDNFSEFHIDETAKRLGISVDDVRAEVESFRKGIHPTTRRGAEVLRQVALSDTGYQAKAAEAGLGVRLSGDYYETMDQRKYDKGKDAAAAKTTMSRVKLFAKKVFGSSQSLPQATENIIIDTVTNRIDNVDQSIVKAAKNKTRTASPSQETTDIGEDIGQGFINGGRDKVDDAQKVGEQIGDAVVGGARTRGRRATSGGIITPGMSQSEQLNAQRASHPRVSRIGDLEQRILLQQQSQLLEDRNNRMSLYENRSDPKVKKQRLAALKEKFGSDKVNARISSKRIAGATRGLGGKMFGVSAVAGLASMSGGPVGQISGIVSMVTGVLGMFGEQIGDFVKKNSRLFLKFGKLFAKFLPGIGMALTLFEVFQLLTAEGRKRYEQEKRTTAAMKVSTEQVSAAANFFGISVKNRSFYTAGKSQDVGTVQQNAINEILQNEDFKAAYSSQIETLKNSTARQAQMILTNLAIKLAPDFAPEQIAVIIESLKQQAGKTDVTLDLNSLIINPKNVVAGITAGLSALPDMSKTLSFTPDPNASNLGPTSGMGSGSSGVTSWATEVKTEPAKPKPQLSGVDIEKAKQSAELLKTTYESLNSMFQDGTISIEEYNKGLAEISSRIRSINDEGSRNIVMENWINSMEITSEQKTGLIDGIEKLSNVDDQLVAISASGVNAAKALALVNEMAKVQSTDPKKYENLKNQLIGLSNLNSGQRMDLTGKSAADINKELESQSTKAEAGTGAPTESDKLGAALTLIGQKEDKINKKYDERKKALEKVASLQKSITEQQQQQLDIASALSRGDVAAAARAVQQLRTGNAARALDIQQQQLEQARQNELEGVTDPLGRTRAQIEERQNKIAAKEAKNTLAGKGGTGGKAAEDGGDKAYKAQNPSTAELSAQGKEWYQNKQGHWRIRNIASNPMKNSKTGPGFNYNLNTGGKYNSITPSQLSGWTAPSTKPGALAPATKVLPGTVNSNNKVVNLVINASGNDDPKDIGQAVIKALQRIEKSGTFRINGVPAT